MRNLLPDAYLSLTSRPGRTVAMMAGIVLGVASVVAAIVLADTQQAQIDKRFDLQRSDRVVIRAQSPGSDGFPRSGMTQVAALAPVRAAGELSIWRTNVAVAAGPFSSSTGRPLVVADAGGLVAAGARTVAGADVRAIDRTGPSRVIWLGVVAAADLGVDLTRPSSIVVAGLAYTVAGTLTSAAGFTYLDSAVVMARALAVADLPGPETVRAVVHVRPGSAASVADRALAALDPERSARLVDATQPDGRILLGSVARDLRTIGLALGLFVGLVGMVGVANTLSMSVAQRTAELGLRAAMGWNRRRIGALVLVESGISGLLAGIVGCALGLLGTLAWCAFQGWELIVDTSQPVVVGLCGVAASLVGGIAPAYRAASISPVTALRS